MGLTLNAGKQAAVLTDALELVFHLLLIDAGSSLLH